MAVKFHGASHYVRDRMVYCPDKLLYERLPMTTISLKISREFILTYRRFITQPLDGSVHMRFRYFWRSIIQNTHETVLFRLSYKVLPDETFYFLQKIRIFVFLKKVSNGST